MEDSSTAAFKLNSKSFSERDRLSLSFSNFLEKKALKISIIVITLFHLAILTYHFTLNAKSITIKKETRVRLQRIKMPNQEIRKKQIAPPSDISQKIAPIFDNLEELIEIEDEVEELIEEIEYVDYIEETIIEYDESEINETTETYISIINRSISLKKEYPKMAKRLNQEGVVEVSFVILSDGRVTNPKIVKACRFSSLNKAALKTVQSLEKLPPIPELLNKEDWEFIIPIYFELN